MQLLRPFIYLVLLISAHFFNQFDAMAQRVNQPVDPSFYEGYKWRNLGPNRGGRSLSSTGSPGRVNEYYFGATGGGLWKTIDGGNDWFPSQMVRSSHQVLGQLLWRKQILILSILEEVKRS